MEMSASKLWEKILKIIKKRVNEVEFNTFFKNVEAEEIKEEQNYQHNPVTLKQHRVFNKILESL